VGTRLNGPIPKKISSLTFTDAQGHTRTLRSYRNKVIVLYAAMTSCTSDCPLDTANIVTAAKATDRAGLGNQVEYLSATIDPGRDSPQRLAAYRRLYAAPGQLPNWDLLTGRPEDVAALWKYLGVYWRKVPFKKPYPRDWQTGKPLTYDVEHADEVFLIDTNEHERFVISGRADVPRARAVPRKLRDMLDKTGRAALQHPGQQDWTVDGLLEAVSWLTGQKVTTSN
jgi:protein SCO1/2